MEEKDEEFSSSLLLNGGAWEPIPFQSREWEMVEENTTTTAAANASNNNNNNNDNDDLSIFPPSNHEGLHIDEDDDHDHDVEEHGPPPPPPLDVVVVVREAPRVEPLESRIRIAKQRVMKQLRLGLEVFSSKIFRFLFLGRYYYAARGVNWSFASRAGASVALMASLLGYLRWWQRRQSREDRIDRLILLVRHQDEKMNQLLGQISYLNELLSTRRRIPVLTTG